MNYKKMDIQNITPDLWMQQEAKFLEGLQERTNWDSIPSLNANDVQNLQDQKLVKFQGMVQDMFNPEYFYEQYEVINENTKEKAVRNGKFTDIVCCKDEETINYDSKSNVTKERHTMVVITTPGLNEWVRNAEKIKYTIPSPIKIVSQDTRKKRTLETEEEMEVEPTQTSNFETKKQCTTEAPPNERIVSREHLLNFPILEHQGKACHVKLYTGWEQIKLNDLVEIIGFLSVDPILTDFNSEEDCDNNMEVQTHNPPPSLIPRVHCVYFKKLAHTNLLADERLLNVDRIHTIKKDLHIALTQLLLGDALTAEYLIYHLISKVYTRQDLLPLGKFALNILNVPAAIPDFAKHLSEFISLMVPTSHYLPMTLENMNELAFIPKKDYECDRLTSGLLQLSPNTHFILDETKLTAGRLNASGVTAVEAISSMIKHQKITYDFNYYPIEFECDLAFLILSEGKTLLSSDFDVHLNFDSEYIQNYQEILQAAKVFLTIELLNDIRVYLTQVRHASYKMTDHMHKIIEEDYVSSRQTESITAEDLHRLLVLTRLICLSEGKTQLDANSWKKARELEEERKNRNS